MTLTNTYTCITSEKFSGDIFVKIAYSLANIRIMEEGITVQNTEPWTTGDLIEIEVVGTIVKVKRNGVVFYTSGKTFVLPLKTIGLFDAAANSIITNARFKTSNNLILST